MAGSLSVRKKNAEKQRVTKGQSLSARRPGVVETIYDYLDYPLQAFGRATGLNERDAYENSKKLSGGIEGLLAPQSTERALRGTGNTEDYINAGLFFAPFAAKPAARLLKGAAKVVTPKVVQRGIKAAVKYAARPSYLSDKAAVKMVREGRAADRALAQGQGALSTVAEAAPAAALEPRVVFPTPAAAAPTEPTGIIAYHGSPHSFDRFDISKIGTGEGAQAYGHGLYFAENEDVARSYRDALRADNGFSFGGLHGLTRDQVNELVASEYGGHFVDNVVTPRGISDSVMDTIIHGQMGAGRKRSPEYTALRDELSQKISNSNPGSMYQVRINADPADFLDWDAPYGQQTPSVQDAIRYAFGPQDDAAVMAGYSMDKPREMHTRLMREKGIPGIKYLDQGSRIAGDGSRNYVVFDDALIDLLRKYAMGGAVTKGSR